MASVAHAAVAGAAPLDAAFTETVVETGLLNTTGMAWAPDGTERLFVITKAGEVRIVERGVLLATPFATLSPVRTSSECGLIGIAFDPSFVTTGHVYLFVTVSATEQQIIRLTANGNVAEDERVIVPALPTRALNHNGGGIGIGPDGKLYWAIGDNGNYSGVGPDLLTLAAKVGRANLDGSVPSDNPFKDDEGPNNDYVWARGFRNPFTLTFQPSTERLWVSTVGTVYEQIFTPFAGADAGYNKYESNQPSGFLPPAIAYRTNLQDMRQVVEGGAARVGGVATYTTKSAHRFRPGAKVTVTGVVDPTFDENDFITSVPTPNTFTFTQPGPDATSGTGSILGPELGGCVTGGAFWDSSGAPPTHAGDFFFGDYNSGYIIRAHLGTGTDVLSVDLWANTIASPIDVEVGADGDLYFLGHHGSLYRTRHNFEKQQVIVSRLHLRTFEGGGTAFNVRLALEPTVDRIVSIARSGGDDDLAVTEGASLTFTAANWQEPQRVLLAAQRDDDLEDDEATFDVSSVNVASHSVRLRVTDLGDSEPPTTGAAGDGGARSQAQAGEAGVPADGGGQTAAGRGGEAGQDFEPQEGGTPGMTGGGLSAGGAPPTANAGDVADDGCGCRTVGSSRSLWFPLGLALLVLGGWRRRRRARLESTRRS